VWPRKRCLRRLRVWGLGARGGCACTPLLQWNYLRAQIHLNSQSPRRPSPRTQNRRPSARAAENARIVSGGGQESVSCCFASRTPEEGEAHLVMHEHAWSLTNAVSHRFPGEIGLIVPSRLEANGSSALVVSCHEQSVHSRRGNSSSRGDWGQHT
jgi:hypothetical protein